MRPVSTGTYRRPRVARPRAHGVCVSRDVRLLLAVGVMAGAADLHHVNLGRVLALLAAILAALRRGATTGLARTLLLLTLVRHLNLLISSTRCSGRGILTQVSTRDPAKVKPEEGMRDEEEEAVFIHPSSLHSSLIPLPSSLPFTVPAGRRCGRALCRRRLRVGCRVEWGWSCR
ncbi:MAG: hypothetical protein QOE46_849 [Acidobacteriota bacterium]|nr:hypothetical protein [Acidobacteriota bacterium]